MNSVPVLKQILMWMLFLRAQRKLNLRSHQIRACKSLKIQQVLFKAMGHIIMQLRAILLETLQIQFTIHLSSPNLFCNQLVKPLTK